MEISLGARHDFLRRFGVPVGWAATELADLAHVVGGGTPSRDESRYWQGGKIPWATPTDLTANDSKYISHTAECITDAGLAESAATLLPVGALLYTSRATIGAKAIAEVPIATNQGFASFVPTSVNGQFLFYMLDLLTPTIKRLGAGTTFDEVSKRDIRKVWCAVPSSPNEQAAIACVLDAIDTAIEHTRTAIQEAKKLKSALVQQFFYSALGETAYADRPKKKIPKRWTIMPTETLLVGEPKNGASPKASTQPPGTPTFSIAAVRDGRVNLHDQEHIKYGQLPENVAEQFRVKRGDVLIVRGNANSDLVGKAGVIDDCPEGCIYPDITKRVVFRAEGDRTVTPAFAVLAWNCSIVHNQVLRRAKTSNGTLKINSRDVKQIIMPIPPPDEQSAIVKLAGGVGSKIDALTEVLHAQKQLKRSLIDDLLTGRVRVKNFESVPRP
jgi:type I restriction enzyme, S subunit